MSRFRTGTSVSQAKKDARRLAINLQIPLHQALDRVAYTHGESTWAIAMDNQGKYPKKYEYMGNVLTKRPIRVLNLGYPDAAKMLGRLVTPAIELSQDSIFSDYLQALDCLEKKNSSYDMILAPLRNYHGEFFLNQCAERFPSLARVAFSACHNDEELPSYEQRTQFHYFLHKPVLPLSLVKALRKFLISHREGTPVQRGEIWFG